MERLTVLEAAHRLGISEGAVRKRIDRDTVRHEKGADGRVYVYLPDRVDIGQTAGEGDMVAELRDRVRFLERQVEEERESRRRADTIIAQLSQANAEQARTIRALEAPASTERPPEGAESTATGSEGADPRSSSTEGPERPTQRRSWWREFFGVGG